MAEQGMNEYSLLKLLSRIVHHVIQVEPFYFNHFL